MKKIAKCFDVSKLLIIALAVVIAFSMTACKDDDGDSNDNSNGNGDGNVGEGTVYFGNTLELSGQVYLENWNYDYSLSYENFTGNLAIENVYGGSGDIKNGILSYSIGVPTGLETINLRYYFEGMFDDDFEYENITPGEVKGVFLYSLPIASYGYLDLLRELYNRGANSITYEQVAYMYVENDVTINGKGSTDTSTYYEKQYTEKLEDFNLTLKTGWNTLYFKYVDTETSGTTTATVSLSNPDRLKWVTYDYGY